MPESVTSLRNTTGIIIFFFCIVKLMLHLIGDFNTGFQGDELLHIATGSHPSFGYMEFPPMIGWMAFIQNQFHSESVFIHHLFTHIASLLILILTALVTMQLGGKTRAVFLVLLCILVAPCFGRGHQLFQPVVFSQLFWLLSFYFLTLFVKNNDQKYLLYLTLSIVLGFLAKFDIVFFIGGLSGLLFFRETREKILTRSLWIYILLFTTLISPNLWWQYQHQFPVFSMFSRLYETQLDNLTMSGVLKDLIISMNPATSLFWIGGLLFMFNQQDKTFYRPIATSIALSLFWLALGKSKAYYFYPAMITVLPFGAIWFEQKIISKRKWTIYPASAMLVISGLVLIPFGLAVMPLDSFIQFAQIEKSDGRYKIDYTEYYSRQKWQNTMCALKEVYDSLPPTERSQCMIWGKHYSQAGAINLYRASYGLPQVFSYHGSFYLWAPEKGSVPQTIIAYSNGEAKADFFQPFFETVIPVQKVYNPYADEDKHLYETIFICKKPRQDFAGLKRSFSGRVFE